METALSDVQAAGPAITESLQRLRGQIDAVRAGDTAIDLAALRADIRATDARVAALLRDAQRPEQANTTEEGPVA